MERVLSFLSSATDPWLSFGHLPSAFVDIYLKCIFLSAVGVLLLYLRYLILKPLLPTWNNQDIRKQQGTAKKGKWASFKELRIFHREAKERRQLLSVVHSPFGQLYDASHFRQVLCPDPGCDVCNAATAKVSHLLSWATPEDGAASASSVPSTASATETSFTLSPPLSPSPLSPSPPPPSILSTSKVTPLEDILLCAPQGDSLPSEPVLTSTSFPLDHIPSHPLATIPPEAQPATPPAEGSLQLETTPSVEGSLSEQFINPTTNEDTCGDISDLSPSQLECLVNPLSSEAFLGGQTTVYFTVPGKPSFPNPKVLTLLERQDKSQADFLMLKDREEKAETFPNTLTTWEKIPEPAPELQNSGGSLPLEGSKGMLSELIVHRGLAQAQSSENQLEPTFIQHFWGLPYLHSESMNTITTLSAHCSSVCVWFNRTPDSSVLIQPTPLFLAENQSQTLAQAQSQSILFATSQTQLQSPIPTPSPSPQSQLRICGVYFHRSQHETKTLTQSGIQQLGCSILTNEQERVWGLPSVAQNSQEKLCLPPSEPSLVGQSSRTHAPRSVSPGDFPLTEALRKKLECHLQKRLSLQRWGLSQSILKSQPWVSPDLAEPSVNSYGFSWISVFQHQDSKDPHNTVLSQPGSSESLSLKGKMIKAQGHCPQVVQRYLCSSTKDTLDNGLKYDRDTDLQCLPGTSQVSQCRKKFEAAIQEQLSRHFKGTREARISGTMSTLRHRAFPCASHVGKEEHEAQRQSPSDNKDGHVKNAYSMTKSVLHQASIDLDNTRLKESEGNRRSPDMPRKSTEADSGLLGKQLDLNKTVRELQEIKVNNRGEFVSNKVSNIVKGGQLSGFQPQTTNILKTSQCESTHGADGNSTKLQSTPKAGRIMKEISGPQESQTSDYNSPVSREEKFKSERRLSIQALGPQNDMLPASHKITYKPLLMHDQGPSVHDYGPSMNDHSAPMNDYSVSMHDHSPSMNDHCPSMHDHSGPMHGHSASMHDHSGPMHGHSASMHDHSGPMHGHSASMHDHSAPMHDHSPSMDDHSAPMHDQRPSMNDHCPSMHDHSGPMHGHSAPMHDYSPSMDDHSAPMYDQRPSMNDHSPSIHDHCPSMHDHSGPMHGHSAPMHDYSPSMDDHSAPMHDHHPSMNDHSAPMHDQHPSMNDHCPSMHDHSGLMHGHSAPMHDHRPSMNDHSAPMHDQCPSMNDHSPSIHDHCPSMHDHSAPMHDHRPSMNDHSPSIHDHCPSMHDHSAPMHDHRPSMHDHSAPMHDHHSSVHDHSAPMHDYCPSMHDHSAAVHDYCPPMNDHSAPMHDHSPMHDHRPSVHDHSAAMHDHSRPVNNHKLSRGPMNASQMQQQEPWMPPHNLGQKEDIPPPSKKVWPAPWKMEVLGAGVARSGTLQANGKSCQAQDSPIQGNHGGKLTQPLPVKALTSPEHQLRKHVKHFLQWLSPDRKCKGQEKFLRKGISPTSSVQDPELVKGRATFSGNTIAQKAMRDPGKVSKEQLGPRHGAAEPMHLHMPLSPPTQPVKTKPLKESWVPAQLVQGRLLHHQAACPNVQTPRSYNQATAFVGQKRWVEDRGRQLQKGVVFQPHPPAPYGRSELHRNLSRKTGQVPQAALPFAAGTVLADLSRLCEQKIQAQNFSGKGFLPQK